MAFTAIRVKSDNAPLFKQVLDLTINDLPDSQGFYLVNGFDGPVSYMILSHEMFNRRWRFRNGEVEGQFAEVVSSSFFKGVQ